MFKIDPRHILKLDNTVRLSITPIHKTSPKKFYSEFPKVEDGARTGLSEKEFNKLISKLKKK